MKNPKNSLFSKKILNLSNFPYIVENPYQILPKNEVFNRCFFLDTFWHQPQKVSKKDRLKWKGVLFFLPKKFCLAKRTTLSPLKTLPSPPRRTFGAGRAQGVWFLKERGSRLVFSSAKTNFTVVKLRHSLSLSGGLDTNCISQKCEL